MSEGGGTPGPEISGGPNYANSGSGGYTNPPSQPPTPSSTVQDPPSYANAESESDSKSGLHSNSNSGLPPFSSFSAADVAEGLGGRLASDGYLGGEGISSTRIMELSGIPGWDYCYTDGRYLDGRGESMPLMIPQPQYRPWESKQDGSNESFKSGLPSFQSQFGEELVTTLTTLTPAACSPAPSVPSPGLPSFHTLSAVNPRYPLVPAPVQAREIPSIQQQFLDERHIHLFQGAPGQNFALQPQNGTLTSLNNATTLTTLNNAQYHLNNAQLLPGGQLLTPQSHILGPSSQIITSNGHIITSSGGPGLTVVSQNSTPTVLTVVKTEPVNIVELKSSSHHSGLSQIHHPHFHNPLLSQGQHMESKFGMDSPPRGIDGRKKERRKIRASSLESSNESDGAMSVESSGQVAAVSSTAGFKSPMNPGHLGNEGDGMITDTGEKQTKKKRKRCGECIGCQRKDNCGDCAPCRNDKSHQICKMRRCEKLTEKKHLLAYNREDGGTNFRGRGRGRGRGSRGGYRGKAPRPGSTPTQNSSVSNDMNSSALGGPTGRESVKAESVRVNSTPITANPAIPPTMAVPFYGASDVWPSGASDTWTAQGQFIPQMDDLRYQHYPGYQAPGLIELYPTAYQQSGFGSEQSSAFQPQYGSQPATSPAQGSATPRSANYTQVQPPTPSPIGSNPPTPHVNGHRNGISVHYVEEGSYVNGNSFSSEASMVPPPSTTPASRCSSTHGANDNGDQQTNKASYMSGNDQPGYPPNSPQHQSLCNSNGYSGQSGQSEYGDQPSNGTSYQPNQKSPAFNQPHPSPGYQNQSYQNYNHISPEQQQQQQRSPSQKHGCYTQNSPNHFSPAPSPNYDMYEHRQGGQYYGDFEKSNVNARIKSMIMNKQGRGDSLTSPSGKDRPSNDYGGKKDDEAVEDSNHFLAFSHHLREGSILHPGGGGYQNWGGPMPTPNHNYESQYFSSYDYNQNSKDSVSAMERFMKFASADFDKIKPYAPVEMEKKTPEIDLDCFGYYKCHDPIRNLEANFPTKRLYENNNSMCGYYPPVIQKRHPDFAPRNCYNCPPDIKPEFPNLDVLDYNNVKIEPKTEGENIAEDEKFDSLFPRISYAPGAKNMEVIDRRFTKTSNEPSEKWMQYTKMMEEERKDTKVKIEEEVYAYAGDGGPMALEGQGAWCCRQGGTEKPTPDHLRDGCCQGLQTADEVSPEQCDGPSPPAGDSTGNSMNNEGSDKKHSPSVSESIENIERLKNSLRSDVPECSCFPPDKAPTEPGSYYTHLGAAASLKELRVAIEKRLGEAGMAVRIEKICYTGKEGKTTQGCPLAKWVIRRSGPQEKFLALVKLRQGHSCSTSWIVVCIIAWDGVPSPEADKAYNVLSHKLSRFGLPTTRRCATNEPRTCACQGLDPDTCGTSFSFGCSWSMYYNGCKYARSKTVRKFRLSVRGEEQEVEERMHVLATLLSPLYNTVAPEAFQNQTLFEREASECRLGFKPGRPFSGVTACVDFCAHAHRDLHNMNNGCTVVVSLTKHRSFSKPDDEQLHILPLYVMDDTDEFGSKENQEEKYKNGSIECLNKFPCEVRMRAVPLQPCRRHGKKRRDEEVETPQGGMKGKSPNSVPSGDVPNLFDNVETQLQSSQVSSTVLDSPGYHSWGYQHQVADNEMYSPMSWNESQRKQSWMHSPTQPWGYAAYERDIVDADSTTTHNQAFSPCSHRSSTSISGASNTMSSGSPLSSPLSSHQWQQSGQSTGEKYREEDREGEEKRSPLWGEYPSSPSPIRQSPSSSPSLFRIPKGRPPSRQTHISEPEQCETFLKPLPKDNQLHEHIKVEGKSPFNSTPQGYPKQYQDCKPGWGDFVDERYSNYGYQPSYPNLQGRWDPYCPPPPFYPSPAEPAKAEPLGEVTDFIENEECFRDAQMGGVGIALGHGSVLFEVAKHELHSTTALKRPNRQQPTRISLVFYQHRNLNRAKHGWDEWEEKMRLRKLGITVDKNTGKDCGGDTSADTCRADALRLAGLEKPPGLGTRFLDRAPTHTTITWTTLFPMRPCMVTGPYQEGGGE